MNGYTQVNTTNARAKNTRTAGGGERLLDAKAGATGMTARLVTRRAAKIKVVLRTGAGRHAPDAQPRSADLQRGGGDPRAARPAAGLPGQAGRRRAERRGRVRERRVEGPLDGAAPR